MKQLNTLLLLLFTILSLEDVSAQTGRYRTNVFTGFTKQADVEYAKNIAIFPVPGPASLKMDIYSPAGDTEKNRPVVIYFHTGTFLPQVINQGATGSKNDSSCVEFARRLTKMGYVVCVASYRLGWLATATNPNLRTSSILQAAYRGIQDARAAIRFIRKSVAENSNPYGVDPNRIVLWGQGTGGYLAAGSGFLDRFKEEIEINKFINTETLTAFVDTNTLSNPFGTTVKPQNLVNHLGYSSDFNMAVNMGGALGDLGWIEGKAGEPAVIGFQVFSDPFAPFGDGNVLNPVTREFIINVSGSRAITEKVNRLNLNSKFSAANEEQSFINLRNKALSAVPAPFPYASVEGKATTLSTENMYPFFTPGNRPEAGPWEWWDTTTLKAVVAQTNAGFGTTFDWRVIHGGGLATNPNMSKAKAMAYIDTIMAVFTPRAYLQLNLATSTHEIISEDVVKLKIGPNPVADRIYLESASEFKMRDIGLYSLDGKMVRGYANVDENDFELQRGSIPPGTYVLQVRFDKGVVAKKLILK